MLNSLHVGSFLMLLLSSADFFHFFFNKCFRNTIGVSNGLNLDQDQHSVSPDLGPNCFQKLSADGNKKQVSIGFCTFLESSLSFAMLNNFMYYTTPQFLFG